VTKRRSRDFEQTVRAMRNEIYMEKSKIPMSASRLTGVDTDPTFLNLVSGISPILRSWRITLFEVPPRDGEGIRHQNRDNMKAYQLLSSSDTWCQESPAKDAHGNKVSALHPQAVKWCALAALQRVYPPLEWEEAMDRLLRALSVSEKGIRQLSKTDKACCLMEWNDDRNSSFRDIQEILFEADV
jgi:hypothetical protein